MTIQATVIADSISDSNVRITTFQLRYPRFIHAEFMTHRKFSRNASSSRAIPVKKMIDDLLRDPALPVYWGSNKPGMQAGEQLTGNDWEDAEATWLLARSEAIEHAKKLVEIGLHKQIANRILEPWAHINVVCTATDYRNFYALRRHPDAQPEIKALADAMFEAESRSEPIFRRPGEWHLPYIRPDERQELNVDNQKMVSVARCARVSYLTHDGRETSPSEDIELYGRLIERHPIHASPAEHQATPMINHNDGSDSSYMVPVFQAEHLGGNFRGWRQLRKMLDGEFIPG